MDNLRKNNKKIHDLAQYFNFFQYLDTKTTEWVAPKQVGKSNINRNFEERQVEHEIVKL